MKNIFTILFLSILVTSCGTISTVENKVSTEEAKVSTEDISSLQTIDEEVIETTSPEYIQDKKLWSLNKGIMMLLDEYADSNNGGYPDSLSIISDSLSKLEDIDFDSVSSRYEYDISSDSLGNTKGCYEVKMKFESKYYSKYHTPDGYFILKSPKGSCQK